MSDLWPLLDLVVRTPRLTLRYVDDARAAQLVRLAATAGVHEPDEQPFRQPWPLMESPRLERAGLQGIWSDRGRLGPDAWNLPFAVYEDDVVVGSQDLRARSFPVTRTVGSGSWVGLPWHRRGIGKEMRAAVLHLAFAGLGAELAETGAFVDNHASIAVTRALGYVDNGWSLTDRNGEVVRDLAFRLERSTWELGRRDDITIEGLDPCPAAAGPVIAPRRAWAPGSGGIRLPGRRAAA